MDKMQSKQHTLREGTLTHNTLNCMVCLKKHLSFDIFRRWRKTTLLSDIAFNELEVLLLLVCSTNLIWHLTFDIILLMSLIDFLYRWRPVSVALRLSM